MDHPQPGHKAFVREEVWAELRKVALPDSRFHYDFSSFIADFQGSEAATLRLAQLPCYKSATTLFITPDNCLKELRLRALRDGKSVLITTYAIRRGFWLLDPKILNAVEMQLASYLDGLEEYARPVQLSEIEEEGLRIDLMVTGTGAINMDGIRFGKGHGFFDLEWAMLYTMGVISQTTQTVAIVHDCQLLTEKLVPEQFDTVCDTIVTPTRVVEVPGVKKPDCGILWDKLAEGMLESIPPLQELRALNAQQEAKLSGPLQ